MRNKLGILVAALVLFSISMQDVSYADTPKSVSSLSQVRGKIDSADGKAIYDQQMNGIPLPDGFGTSLPPGVNTSDVVRLLLPKSNPSIATLVGMKRWPYRKGAFIAIACLAPNQVAMERALKYNNRKPICDVGLIEVKAGAKAGEFVSTGDYSIAVGVVEMQGSERLTLASTVVSWTGIEGSPLGANWSHSNLSDPAGSEEETQNPTKDEVNLRTTMSYPSELQKFDFAKYVLSDTTVAFGIRSGINEGYAGGGKSFQILTLFAAIGGELRAVFSEPVYYSSDLAGDLNEDGTRNHTVDEGTNVIVVSKTMTNGYYNLIVKSKENSWSKEFRWDKNLLRYTAGE